MRTSRRFSRSVEIGRWHRLCRFRQTDKIHSLLTEDADLARVDDQLGEREKFVLRCVRIALSMVFRQPPWNLLRIQRVRMCKARPSVGENRPLREMSSSMDALAVFHQLTRVWT